MDMHATADTTRTITIICIQLHLYEKHYDYAISTR